MPSGSHQARRCVQCLASHTGLSPPPPQKISAGHRACRWLDRETARVGQASFVAQAFILIESGSIALARSIVRAGRFQIRGAHRDCNVRFGSKADIDACSGDVRFTPESGHWLSALRCPLCAKSRNIVCGASMVRSQRISRCPTSSRCFGRCQTKALQVELSELRIAPIRGTRHHDIG